jgi:hypothetical protein
MRFGIFLVVVAALAIGCGGSGSVAFDDTSGNDGGNIGSTVTTATDGGTPGDSPFEGEYEGTMEGENSAGTAYAGTATGAIEADGDATFAYTARIGGAQFTFAYTGKVDNDGEFTGRKSGTIAATGTVERVDSDTIEVVLETKQGNLVTTDTFTLDEVAEE